MWSAPRPAEAETTKHGSVVSAETSASRDNQARKCGQRRDQRKPRQPNTEVLSATRPAQPRQPIMEMWSVPRPAKAEKTKHGCLVSVETSASRDNQARKCVQRRDQREPRQPNTKVKRRDWSAPRPAQAETTKGGSEHRGINSFRAKQTS